MPHFRTPLILALVAFLGWSAFVFQLQRMALSDHADNAVAQALIEARIAFEKDVSYRRWAARLGGVYAEITPALPPNPYLDVPDRDPVTASGRRLTLVNPAYMTRMVHEIMATEAGVHGHITSLNPIRPANAPADWEARALEAFQTGVSESHEMAEENGQRVLRFMRPMVTEKACLKCHAGQGYKEGDIRGGISVTVPMGQYDQLQVVLQERSQTRHGIIFLLGSLFIGGGLLAALRHERQHSRSEQELRASSEKLKASEERFRALLEGAGDAIYIADPGGRLLGVNAEAERQSGYSREELLSMSVQDLDATHSTPEALAEFSRALSASGKAAFESRHRHKGGGEYPVDLHVVRLEVGGEETLLGIARDITGRKASEAALERERSFTGALLDSLPGIFYLYACPDLRLVRWNRNHETVFGYGPEEMLGRSIMDWHPAGNRELVAAAVQKVLDQGSNLLEAPLLTRDGRSIPFLLTGVRFEDSGRVFLMGVGIEITDRKRAEAQLVEMKERAEAANRAKSEFLATMSHEIRTPLNGVLGMLQLILRAPLDADTREFADTAILAARGLLSILNDILDLSRIESGRADLRDEDFSLAELGQASFGFLQAQLRAKNLEARYRMAPDLPEIVRGDQGRLRQILFNLLGNAIKFTESGSVSLDIEAAPGPGRDRIVALFTVRDTGIGIPEDKLDTVFEPFAQADASATRRYGGTGLGLAIVRRLLTMMGGSILMDSREGQGTEVCVAVPLAIPVAPPLSELFEPAPSVLVSGLKGLAVLVAEDDRINQMTIRTLLAQEGCTPDLAANGQEALAALAAKTYDLVLMDIQMPVMDGLAATRAIRESSGLSTGPGVPLIAMTAYAMAGDREAFLAAGMDDYIAKPVEMGELRRVVARVLGRAAARVFADKKV